MAINLLTPVEPTRYSADIIPLLPHLVARSYITCNGRYTREEVQTILGTKPDCEIASYIHNQIPLTSSCYVCYGELFDAVALFRKSFLTPKTHLCFTL